MIIYTKDLGDVEVHWNYVRINGKRFDFDSDDRNNDKFYYNGKEFVINRETSTIYEVIYRRIQ